jgi:hypothetical protein
VPVIGLDRGMSMLDLKKQTIKGYLEKKHLSTCPILPKFHAAFGEPTEIQPGFVEYERNKEKQDLAKTALKYLNRCDHIEIDKKSEEVFIKDDFNIYVMYECSMTDMQLLEEEIVKIGTYYIS